MSGFSPGLFIARARTFAPVGVNTAVPAAGVNWRFPKVKEVITKASA